MGDFKTQKEIDKNQIIELQKRKLQFQTAKAVRNEIVQGALTERKKSIKEIGLISEKP